EPESSGVARNRELDRLSGQRLGLTLQQDLCRKGRAVAAARPATGGVARLALLEEPTSRTLALLLQGICSHSRLLALDKSGQAGGHQRALPGLPAIKSAYTRFLRYRKGSGPGASFTPA